MTRERIKIEGMGCQHCVDAVRKALDTAGVEIHNVSIGQADVSYTAPADREKVDAAIEEAGYKPTGREVLS